MDKEIIAWLLKGDVSIQYQTYKDLLDVDEPKLKEKIEFDGWGSRFLSYRHHDGHWGKGFYQPKWTSSHYTLLDLKNLQISPENEAIRETLHLIFNNEKARDGGILPIGTSRKSDVCINGMLLNYSSYFRIEEACLYSVVDFLLSEKMGDGGFNCQSNRKGATHSSLHSTLSVLEGILEYENTGYNYRLSELQKAKQSSEDFILQHKLFRSDKTDKIINPNFLKLYYPSRWYYDILKAMDYFQFAKVKYDVRMEEAITIIKGKQNKDGLWKLAANHPGQTHFDMEKPGNPSRWNTLRALRILKYYKQEN